MAELISSTHFDPIRWEYRNEKTIEHNIDVHDFYLDADYKYYARIYSNILFNLVLFSCENIKIKKEKKM